MKISIIPRGSLPSAQKVLITYQHKRLCRIFTGIIVASKDFQNKENQWIKPTASNHITKNQTIQKKKAEVEKFALDYQNVHGDFPDHATVAKHFDKRFAATPKDDIQSVWDRFIHDITHRDKNSIGLARVKNYNATIKRLLEYDPFFNLGKVDDKFFYGFGAWMRETEDKATGRNKAGGNTILSHFSRLKRFLRWTNEEGLSNISEAFLRKLSYKWEERDIIFHTNEDMRLLEQANLSFSAELEDTRRQYLFQCYTGIRFGDIDPVRWELNNGFLRFKAQKTGKEVRVPLCPEALSILAYYRDNNIPFPKNPSNSDYNEKVKKIGLTAGLNRPVLIVMGRKKFKSGQTVPMYLLMSSHVARATFVCDMCRHGVHIETIAEMLGVDPKTLKHYRVVEDKTLLTAMDGVVARRGDMRVSHVEVKSA